MDKDTAIALAISFFLSGLGIAYLGNAKKGAMIFGSVVVCHILSIFFFTFSVIEFIIWAYGMYATYQEANLVNGA